MAAMMNRYTARCEEMLFDHETTQRTDYRGTPGPMSMPYTGEGYKEKPKRPRLPYTPVKFIHTLRPWKKNIPFNLLIKPKDILQTNPHEELSINPYEIPKDPRTLEVRRTRPRLVMTPALSMDDIDNEKARDILMADMYTSEQTAAQRNAALPISNVKAPMPGHYAPPNPTLLEKWKPPYVSPEWRWKDSVEWDRRQLRGHVEATKEFWLDPKKKPHTKCIGCEQYAKGVAHSKMMEKMKIM